jgi:zinc protease
MASALFGPGHPYGYTEIGTEASNKALTRDAMVSFWQQRLVPGNAALVVVGAVSRKELQDLATTAFARWSGKAAQRTAMPQPAATDAKLILVDTPGAAQTQLRVASLGVARATPDFEAIEVMNSILGGLFTSRINLNLREDKGYTYGAFSAFAFRREPGPFFLSAGVRSNATAPAATEMIREIRRMQETPISGEELALGVDSLVRSLPGRFETSAQAAGSFATLFVYSLGLDYYPKYIERLRTIDATAVQAAARKYLLPDQLLVVAVGDRKQIEPELQKLNLGTSQYRDADANVIGPASSAGGMR